MTGQSEIQRPSPYGESPGLSYVKSRDVPGARKVPDSDQQRQAWLESLEPAQRAEMEERILRSEQEDDAFFARVATHRSLQALGCPTQLQDRSSSGSGGLRSCKGCPSGECATTFPFPPRSECCAH